jgi:hypothetical protein
MDQSALLTQCFGPRERSHTETQPLSLDGKVWLVADARIDRQEELIQAIESKLLRKLRVKTNLPNGFYRMVQTRTRL